MRVSLLKVANHGKLHKATRVGSICSFRSVDFVCIAHNARELTVKFIALEQEVPKVSPEAYAPHLKDEARTVLALYEQGMIREIYFTHPAREAVIILECANLDEARAVLDGLPLVRNGLIAFKIEALVPYDGFSRLAR